MRSTKTNGEVRRDDGKRNIFWRSARSLPAPTPVHNARRHFRLAKNANPSQVWAGRGAIWRMPNESARGSKGPQGRQLARQATVRLEDKMKYVKLKDFQVAAIAALIALGCLFASPKNTAEAAGISMAAPALHDLARSAPDATVEKAYYHYYRRHYGIRIGTVAIIGIVGIIGPGLTTGITTITRTGVTTGTPTATIGEQPAQFV